MNLPVSIWTNEDCVAFWAEERPETANADACMLKQEAQNRDLTIVRMTLEDIIQQRALPHKSNVRGVPHLILPRVCLLNHKMSHVAEVQFFLQSVTKWLIITLSEISRVGFLWQKTIWNNLV